MLGLNRPILKWWVQFVCSIFAIVVFFELGWMHALYKADITKISMLILTVFIGTQILIGYMSKYTQVVKTRRLANYAWFSSEAMITNWSHNYHKLNHKEISNDDLPGDIVMRTRAQKLYKK